MVSVVCREYVLAGNRTVPMEDGIAVKQAGMHVIECDRGRILARKLDILKGSELASGQLVTEAAGVGLATRKE